VAPTCVRTVDLSSRVSENPAANITRNLVTGLTYLTGLRFSALYTDFDPNNAVVIPGMSMPSDQLNRKLTAILYTDVAGYSRLTGGDEEGTHRQVMEVLDYVSQQISDVGGTVLRYAGDAILAEFSSTVSAVNQAIDIQREMARREVSTPTSTGYENASLNKIEIMA
jgi:hypothetical protein